MSFRMYFSSNLLFIAINTKRNSLNDKINVDFKKYIKQAETKHCSEDAKDESTLRKKSIEKFCD